MANMSKNKKKLVTFCEMFQMYDSGIAYVEMSVKEKEKEKRQRQVR